MSVTTKLYKSLLQSSVLNFNLKLTHDRDTNLDAAFFIKAGELCQLKRSYSDAELKRMLVKLLITELAERLEDDSVWTNFEIRKAITDFSRIYIDDLWVAHWDRNPTKQSFRSMSISFTQASRRVTRAA